MVIGFNGGRNFEGFEDIRRNVLTLRTPPSPVLAVCASSISMRHPCMVATPKRRPFPLPCSRYLSVFGLSRNAPILSFCACVDFRDYRCILNTICTYAAVSQTNRKKQRNDDSRRLDSRVTFNNIIYLCLQECNIRTYAIRLRSDFTFCRTVS